MYYCTGKVFFCAMIKNPSADRKNDLSNYKCHEVDWFRFDKYEMHHLINGAAQNFWDKANEAFPLNKYQIGGDKFWNTYNEGIVLNKNSKRERSFGR